jgi:hypothetical protein
MNSRPPVSPPETLFEAHLERRVKANEKNLEKQAGHS